MYLSNARFLGAASWSNECEENLKIRWRRDSGLLIRVAHFHVELAKLLVVFVCA